MGDILVSEISYNHRFFLLYIIIVVFVLIFSASALEEPAAERSHRQHAIYYLGNQHHDHNEKMTGPPGQIQIITVDTTQPLDAFAL